MFAAHPKMNLSIYPEAGHSLFYENAERFDREQVTFSTFTTSRKAF